MSPARSVIDNVWRRPIHFATLLIEAKQVRANLLNHRVKNRHSYVPKAVLSKMKADRNSGEHCVDKKAMSWPIMRRSCFIGERKGWNICIEEQSISRIQAYAKGAKYFVAQKSYLNQKPGFETELRRDSVVRM